MARIRYKIHDPAIVQLMTSPEAHALVNEKAQALADACNAESTWGGYDWEPGESAIRARARVWSIKRSEAREQRLLRNLSSIT